MSGSAVFRALAARSSECRKERTPPGDDCLFLGAGTDGADADAAAGDWAGLAGDIRRGDRDDPVRRSEDAAEPTAEDRGEEAEQSAERERVAKAVDVEAGRAGNEGIEVVHAESCERAVSGGIARKHEDPKHEQAEESGEHAVPAGAVSRHPARDVTADQVRDEDPDDHRNGGRDVVAP